MLTTTLPEIRWMVRGDLPEVVEIDRQSFVEPWNALQFADCLQNRQVIGMALHRDGLVMGFMLYSLASKTHLELLRLAVHREHRRKGVATLLLHKLATKMIQQRRTHIACNVHEASLPMHLCLKRTGWEALRPVRTDVGYRFCLWNPQFTEDDESCCSGS